MGVNTCCKNCEDRYIGCHSKCERYLDFKQERYKELNHLWENTGEGRVRNSAKLKNHRPKVLSGSCHKR